jgi:hypothetical protein
VHAHYDVSANESRGLKIQQKYSMSLVNSTGEVNSLFDYSPTAE